MRTLLAALILAASPALAAPKIATTLPPLTGLVAQLMQGVATPVALMPANAEPHGFSLKPSQITALTDADLVFSVGLELEPWLERVEADFERIALGDTVSEPRLARNFDMTARTESDPHLWLDPGEMGPWVLEITQNLIRLDHGNAETYRANEIMLLKSLENSKTQLEDIGARLSAAGIRLVVAHDAYQYLEHRLGVQALGMITDFDETPAGARSISRIIRLEGPLCIIDNPEVSAPDGMLPNAPRVLIDPIGADFFGEPNFPALFYQGIATTLEGCFNQP